MWYAVLAVFIVIAVVVAMVIQSRRRDEAWKQLASEVGGEFVKGALFRAAKVQAKVGQSLVTLDTYSVPSGDSSTTYTRMRAPFENKSGFQFSLRWEGLIGKLDKALGMQDIEVGDAEFDAQFIIQGQPVAAVQQLLANSALRQMLQQQKSIALRVKGNELQLEVLGVVRDLERLRGLFNVFKETLKQVQ